jgi:hypothetical protein
MGNAASNTNLLNFEDMQNILAKPGGFLMINTLPLTDQSCLITKSINAGSEEEIINKCIDSRNTSSIMIIIYGRNANDRTPYVKQDQLVKMGFNKVYVYPGGMFEWLMLQDIYGADVFPTTINERDLLKYKPKQVLYSNLIEY